MSSKKKFKRDYIILEAKDVNFRNKERVLPKAFAKIEVNDSKSSIALYVENLKYLKDGYDIMAITIDLDVLDLGKIVLNDQGRGEYVLDLGDCEDEIKSVAIVYNEKIALIGFKGNKLDNYEDVLFAPEEKELQEEFSQEKREIEDNFKSVDEEENIKECEGYDSNCDEEIQYEIEEKNDEEVTQDFDKYESDLEDMECSPRKEMDPIDYMNGRKKAKNKSYKTNKLGEKGVNYQIKKEEKNNNQNSSMNTLMMPRQIKKGLKNFKEVRPFDNDDDTRWWKIDINPTTLCGYSMPNLGYVNALNCTMYSDIVVNSYRHKHYLFGVQYDEYNKRRNYMYAIPGTNSEKPDNGNTGFNNFKSCNSRSNNVGYWVCYIDARLRTILK